MGRGVALQPHLASFHKQSENAVTAHQVVVGSSESILTLFEQPSGAATQCLFSSILTS